MKNRTARRLALLLALLLLLAPLTSCDLLFGDEPEGSGDLSSVISSATDTYFTSGTVTAPPTSEGGEGSVITREQFEAFLSLVNYSKVLTAESAFRQYYIGEYRTVADCILEVYDTVIANYYFEKVTEAELATSIFINSYISVLGDRYGYYYDPSSYGEYTEDISGEYSGIGVSVTLNADGYADILTVFAGSPAEEVGMLPGDLIVGVGDADFAEIGYQEAINRIRGEVGTAVALTVERDGERITFTVTRRKVTEITVEHRMLENNIGYIRITSFDERTYEQFVTAHRALAEAGAVSYIFDVRNNPGGTLTSVVAILEYILPDGDIVHLNYKDDKSDTTIDSIFDLSVGYMDGKTRQYYDNHAITAPMVVLANGNTASAGELFTSSLMDYGVATVLGEKTYGKGVGQTSFYISDDGSAIALTVFSYDPPTSKNYDGVGITPHVAVSLSEEASKKNLYKLTDEEDAQLQAAVARITPSNGQ